MIKFNYKRKSESNRSKKQIELKYTSGFKEVVYFQNETEVEVVDGKKFESFHSIFNPSGSKSCIVFRSKEDTSVLLFVWQEFPYLMQAEEGGDLMIQETLKDKRLKYILNDNTYVLSGWMNNNMIDYLNNAWNPGLIEAGLIGFVHLQSRSSLGKMSNDKFASIMNNAVVQCAQKMGLAPFQYIHINNYEILESGIQNEKDLRVSALNYAYKKLKEIE